MMIKIMDNTKTFMNVAVVGLGYMGQNHARVLSSLEGVDLVALCDADKSKVESNAKKFKVKSYTNYKKLLKEENIQAVFICLPTTLHFEASVFALNLQIPLFIEKPIAANIHQAKKILQLAKMKKVPVMIGHIERFNPVVNEIKQRIKYGELGKVLKIHTQRFSPPPGRGQDVSAITDLATHDIDIVRYLLDEDPSRIFAESETNSHSKEDMMSAILKYKSGVMGIIEVSWLHPNKVRSISIVGENGMYVANYLTQELFFYKRSTLITSQSNIAPSQNWADVTKIAFESKEPLRIELESFISALRNKTKMPVTPEEGLMALIIAQKFSQSGKRHKVLK